MELYSDLVLAVIYFKFNIHTEYTLFLISQTQAIGSLVVTVQFWMLSSKDLAFNLLNNNNSENGGKSL